MKFMWTKIFFVVLITLNLSFIYNNKIQSKSKSSIKYFLNVYSLKDTGEGQQNPMPTLMNIELANEGLKAYAKGIPEVVIPYTS